MNTPEAIIREEIQRQGVLSFARFMELALYCPETGYYEREKDIVGRRGDFFTSVSVGNLFGELLAFQFAEWLAECQSGTQPVQIVEAGAHRGDLARDILIWLREHRADLFHRLEYVIVEPSTLRQKWQSAMLAEFAHKVVWTSNFKSRNCGTSRVRGIIFANELLDAMPVRRFGWNARRTEWFEWGVTLTDGELTWTALDCRSQSKESLNSEIAQHGVDERSAARDMPLSVHRQSGNCGFPFADLGACNDSFLSILPDGFTVERSCEAEAWWRDAAHALECGRLMTIDYGMTIEELISPERKDGTLRGYHRHHLTSDLLAHPGKQDLTAHVNFSALIAHGEANGLKTERFETQEQFLTKIALQSWKGHIAGQLEPSRARQFQTLTHPEHLGRSFLVLVQSRGLRA